MKPFKIATSLRLYGDPILRAQANEISWWVGQNTKLLADDMTRIMYGFNGVGLAGNQVGMLMRIIVVDLIGKPLVMLNPEILEKSKTEHVRHEGCLSLPGINIMVKRNQFIKTQYMDLEGRKQILDLLSPQERDKQSFEIVSRIIQHEVDHLDGILILDKE